MPGSVWKRSASGLQPTHHVRGRAVLTLCCWILPLRPRTGHLRLLDSPTASALTKATAGGHSGCQTDTGNTCGPGATVGEPPGWHQKAQATWAKMESLASFSKGPLLKAPGSLLCMCRGGWGHRQSSQSPVCTCLSWTSCRARSGGMWYPNIKAHPKLTHRLPSSLGPYACPRTPPLPHPLPFPCLSPSLTRHRFIEGEIIFSKERQQSIKPQAQGPPHGALWLHCHTPRGRHLGSGEP